MIMRKIFIMMALMAMTLSVSAQTRSVGEITVGDCRYAINEKDNTVAVCTGLSAAGEQKVYDIEVLEEVTIDGKAYKVTQIGQKAFMNTAIKSIVIPGSVTHIFPEAFEQSEIEKVKFSEGLKCIGPGAFRRCMNLSEIEFPNSLVEILGTSFEMCPIKRLHFKADRGLIDTHAFICPDLEEITFSVDCGMGISHGAFHCPGVKTIVIAGDVKLGFNAFDGLYGLTRIVLKAKKNGERKGMTSGNEFHGAGGYDGNKTRLAEFVSESVLPPTILEDTFSDAQYATTTLVVPQEAIEDYRAATGWSKFVNVRAIAGVDDIAADKATIVSTELYDLYGRAVAEPHSGQIVIERSVMSDGSVRTSKRMR